MIRRAIVGPIPGSDSNSFWLAVFTLIRRLGCSTLLLDLAFFAPVPPSMMGQLEHRGIPNQVRAGRFPECSLMGLAVACDEHRKRPMLDPDSDRVVVLVLLVLGRLGKHRQDDRPQVNPAGALRGID